MLEHFFRASEAFHNQAKGHNDPQIRLSFGGG